MGVAEVSAIFESEPETTTASDDPLLRRVARSGTRLRVAATLSAAAVLAADAAVTYVLLDAVDRRLLAVDGALALLVLTAVFVYVGRLTRQRRRHAVIDEITGALASAGGIDQTAQAAVTLLVDAGFAGAGLLAVTQASESGGVATVLPVARAGYPDGSVEQLSGIAAARVTPAQTSLARETAEEDPWLAPLRERTGPRPWVARAPLMRGDEVLGLLLLVSRRKRPLRDVALLETVGALVASALDRARLYEAAFERQRELETLDGQLREFLYAIAHELRTPLTSIQAFADLLDEDRDAGSPTLVDSLARGVDRLGALVDELLELGRIEEGDVRVDLTAVDVADALRGAEAMLRPSFMQRAQSLSMDLPEGPLFAVGDARSLEQVLLNLLSNANRHTPRRGDVEVRVCCEDDLVRVEVRDSGPGVDPLDRARIFEPFYRVRRPGSTTVPGAGLGLAIARRFTELQGGRIWVEDAAGGGSRFCVELAALPGGGSNGDARTPAVEPLAVAEGAPSSVR